MKFFGKLIKRKELTVVVKEIFNTHNIFFKPVFIKGCFTINFYVAIVPNYFVVQRCILLKGLFCALPMFQDFTIEAREVVKLWRIDILVAVCQKRQSPIIFQCDLRMIFQDASVLVCKRSIQATFKALCIMSKSVILSQISFKS